MSVGTGVGTGTGGTGTGTGTGTGGFGFGAIQENVTDDSVQVIEVTDGVVNV